MSGLEYNIRQKARRMEQERNKFAAVVREQWENFRSEADDNHEETYQCIYCGEVNSKGTATHTKDCVYVLAGGKQ